MKGFRKVKEKMEKRNHGQATYKQETKEKKLRFGGKKSHPHSLTKC